MPRKAKLTRKEKKEKIKDKTLLSQEEANSLEQMIEKKGEEKMDISQFKEFLMNEKINPSEIRELLNSNQDNIKITSSPSLKKINAPQKNPIMLERDIITGNIAITNSMKEDEENEFKYLKSNGKTDEPKYNSNYGEIMGITSREEIEKIPLKGTFQKREIKFESSMQEKTSMQESFDKYSPLEKFDKDKRAAKNPFEKKEVKYTPGGY